MPYKIGLSSILHPRQHSIGYMGDGVKTNYMQDFAVFKHK